MDKYDVVVIGSGPAGYIAAIRCAQLGMTAACVEQWRQPDGSSSLGGTCLNVGCIPSKALLDSSHHYTHMQKHAADHGIEFDNLSIDVSTMLQRKDKIVGMLTKGIEGLFKKNKVTDLRGKGRLLSDMRVGVTDHDGNETIIAASNIIIATGSVPINLPIAPIDDEAIVDSTGALAFDAVPEKLGVIGAGVIGLELGSVWSRLGSEVVILEALPDFLATADKDIARAAQQALKKQGLDIRLGAKVSEAKAVDGKVLVNYEDKNGAQETTVDKLIVAVGRKPNTDGLGAQEVGLELDERGFIQVDEHCQTNLPNVYAIGDVVRGPMLAHKGSDEGVVVAERLAGQASEVEYELMPWVIYTWPEIAWVGQTEQELKEAGVEYKTGKFPFAASGRARAHGDTSGMVKMLADAKTDRILGVHIFGINASELLSEAVLAMAFDGCSEDIARTIHAHPSLAEAMHEASLDIDGRTLNL